MKLTTLKTEVDPVNPYVRSHGPDLQEKSGKENCALHASHGFLVKSDSSRFWGHHITSFTRDVIIWDDYGQVTNFVMEIWIKDVAKGSHLDITSGFIAAVKGNQEPKKGSDPSGISKFKIDDQDRSIRISISDYKGKECISVSGKIASVSLDSEKDISVYLTDNSTIIVKPGTNCSYFGVQSPLHFKLNKYQNFLLATFQFTEDQYQSNAPTYKVEIPTP